MQEYKRKRSDITVQAERLTADNVDKLANLTQSQIVEERDAVHGDISEGLNVKTPHGKVRASRGDYVVYSPELKRFYVAKPGYFEANYQVLRDVQLPEPKETPNLVQREIIKDPFEGMTRFNDGPKP